MLIRERQTVCTPPSGIVRGALFAGEFVVNISSLYGNNGSDVAGTASWVLANLVFPC